MKPLTVTDIIDLGGGRSAVSTASRSTEHEVTYQAVALWETAGIPEKHWPLMMRISGVSVEDLYKANLRAKKKSRESAA